MRRSTVTSSGSNLLINNFLPLYEVWLLYQSEPLVAQDKFLRCLHGEISPKVRCPRQLAKEESPPLDGDSKLTVGLADELAVAALVCDEIRGADRHDKRIA